MPTPPKPAPKAAKPAPKAAPAAAPSAPACPTAEQMAGMPPSELARLHSEFVRAGRLEDAAVIVDYTRRALAERGYSVQTLYDDIVSDGISPDIEDDAALLVACGAVEAGADAPVTVAPPPSAEAAPTPAPVSPAATPVAGQAVPRCVRVTRTFQVLRFPPRDFPRRVGRCDIYHDEIAAWLWEHHRDKVVPFPSDG